MSSPLTDLDELILNCRNSRAKALIHEAVASYRAGAFRASIVATWVAVCFDFIDKLHELSLAGDNEAENQCARLETIRATGDVRSALQVESELLTIARDKFEWLSPVEFTDLERLKEDRNRCAHPSLVAEEQAYSPSAELARLHLFNAVTSVLKHPPAQGKYALQRLVREVSSEYFPVKPEEAKASLEAGPLKKARESLVRNFIVVLLKKYLIESSITKDRKSKARIVAALKATQTMHPQQFDAALRSKLSDIARTIEDSDIYALVLLIKAIPDAWHHLHNDVTQKMNTYVQYLPSNTFDRIDTILEIPQLRTSAEERIKRATAVELCDNLYFELDPIIADRFVDIYIRAQSFDVANFVAREMISYASDFSAAQIKKLISRVSENDQVTASFELGRLLFTLRTKKNAPKDFDSLLKTHGLEKYVDEYKMNQLAIGNSLDNE